MAFEDWLSELFNKELGEVKRLIEDQLAIRFLIVWSIFEAKCFDGFVKSKDLEKFSNRIVAEGLDISPIDRHVNYFHVRYQDKQLYSKLMHRDKLPRLEHLLTSQSEDLIPVERVYLVAAVVYRYRNNIFHGNKGVQSWLKFGEQIGRCTEVMQCFVSHAEATRPTIPERLAA